MGICINKLAQLIVMFLVFGCSSEQHADGIKLYGDIDSYSNFDELSRRHVFSGVKNVEIRRENAVITFVVLRDNLFKNFNGKTRFVFLNHELVELHFLSNDLADVIGRYFPYLEGKKVDSIYVNGFLESWISTDAELGLNYIGLADSRLEKELMDVMY